MPLSSCRVGGCSRDCSCRHRQYSHQPCTTSFQHLSPSHNLRHWQERRQAFWALGEMKEHHLSTDMGQRETTSVEKWCLTPHFPALLCSCQAGCNLQPQSQALSYFPPAQ